MIFLNINPKSGQKGLFQQLYIIVAICACLSSCVSHKNLLNLQSKPRTDSISHQRTEYLLQSGDILDIKVFSMDPQSVAIFNKTAGNNMANQINEAAIYLNGYIVSDSGFISLPLIGNIMVKDLSVVEVKSLVEEKMDSYYKYASIDVKLMNFRVTLLGEVNRQGTFLVYNDRVNILQLIGDAGGVTDEGDRKKIRVIRKAQNKSALTYIDISAADLISSEYYYLQPNDVIYVEPLKAKAFRGNLPTIQVVLSTLTFIVVVLNIISR